VSVETANIEGAQLDGSAARVTVFAADRQGNAVPPGTVVNFTAEGGQIERSCVLSSGSSGASTCSVQLISQAPRPTGGRVSILAYAEGTKDYIDVNGNNRFDAGDSLQNIGDAYRDDDEDGIFDAGEFVVPRGVSGGSCPMVGGVAPSRSDTCDNSLATTVRRQVVVMFSSSQAQIFAGVGTPQAQGGGTATYSIDVNLNVRSIDNITLPMPSGSTVAGQALDVGCSVVETFPGTVPRVAAGTDPTSGLATNHLQRLSCSSGATNVRIRVTVTSPSGVVSSGVYTVSAP
jgi:hypothetical protein